ncbi:MAG: FAD-dependent oxidoreductase [Spirochaetia bacterium]|nr:FAD-dependent oxidoreductase [Spirochaetia bacterium]
MRRKQIAKKLASKGISVVENEFSVVLFGETDSWSEKVWAGALAARLGTKPVVNRILCRNGEEPAGLTLPPVIDQSEEGKEYDVAVIGGGVVGAAVLRELSKWNVKAVLLEKECDLAFHASGRNDGMIHPGFAAKPGSKKAFYNARGNAMYTQLTRELKVPFFRPGSMILLANPLYRLAVPYMLRRARKNGVPGCRYLSKRELYREEPNLVCDAAGGFLMPTSGQLSPQKLVCALAENAVNNGAAVRLETAAVDFRLEAGRITRIVTNRGTIGVRAVINAAGGWADIVAAKACDPLYTLHFRKGEDLILDKKASAFIRRIYAMPRLSQLKSKSKGGGLVPTVEGNVLVGPTAHEVCSRDDYSTARDDIVELGKHIRLNGKLSERQIITYFGGVRACTYDEDFIVRPSERVPNLFHLAGIQSPGLASAPALAEEAVRWVIGYLSAEKPVEPNPTFNPIREDKRYDYDLMNDEEKDAFIKKNPLYGKIVCRCEQVSEGEIRDVLRSPVPPTTLDGIRHRARAMTGRCHGGFCTPKIVRIMTDEMRCAAVGIVKKNRFSPLFFGDTKEEK